jgi:hypothetical protein
LLEGETNYVRRAGTHPGVIASVDGDDIGITTVKHHSPYASEVCLMAVKPAHHRDPDTGYAEIRAFWLASGFRPLEEFPTLRDPSNPALQMIKTVRS